MRMLFIFSRNSTDFELPLFESISGRSFSGTSVIVAKLRRLGIIWAEKKVEKSLGKNSWKSIVRARSITLRENPWEVSSILTVPATIRFGGRGIPPKFLKATQWGSFAFALRAVMIRLRLSETKGKEEYLLPVHFLDSRIER